jgi:hypothetical protein
LEKFVILASALLLNVHCLELDDGGGALHHTSESADAGNAGGGPESGTGGGAGQIGSASSSVASSSTTTAGSSTVTSSGAGGAGGQGGAGGAGVAGGSGGSAGGGGSGPVTCTKWGGSNGDMMRPGEPCLSCHRSFYAAGTVYPTLHLADDCNGIDGNYEIAVVLTDANGQVVTRTVNSWGNFYVGEPVATPFHAKVVNMTTGQERAMTAAQTQRDCNSCHTQNGANNAPGRIMAP